jgi:hypothetical protein
MRVFARGPNKPRCRISIVIDLLFPGTFSMDSLLLLITLGAVMGGSAGAFEGSSSPDSVVVGTWEGESKCAVADSPCHDEHVIYEIARNDKTGGEKIDAYKVVNGEKQFMGSLECRYNAVKKSLNCSGGNSRKKADWEYFVSGDTMTGTLVTGDEKTLYRKISLKRKSGKG